MLRFLLELLPCLLIGVWAGRRHPALSGRLAKPLVRFGVPLSVMGLLLKGGLSLEMLTSAGLAVLAISVVLLVTARFPAGFGLIRPSMRLGCCIGNTAYFGIPLALAFLPQQVLPISIGYDLGATLLTWSVGPVLIGAGGGAAGAHSGAKAWRGLLVNLGSSPATRGLLGALLVKWLPWRSLVTDALWWPSRLVILLALAVVGMRLGSMSSLGDAPGPVQFGLLPALIGKLLLYPLLLLLLGLVMQLDPLMVQAIALQGAAPTAISLLLIAESEGVDQQRAAGLVFWSTVLALITAPLWGFALPLLVSLPG